MTSTRCRLFKHLITPSVIPQHPKTPPPTSLTAPPLCQVHNLITQHHRIVVQGRTDGKEGWLMTADFMEVEESREDLQENLEKLNTQ